MPIPEFGISITNPDRDITIAVILIVIAIVKSIKKKESNIFWFIFSFLFAAIDEVFTIARESSKYELIMINVYLFLIIVYFIIGRVISIKDKNNKKEEKTNE